MKENIIVAKCDVCGIKYAAVQDDKQIMITGVCETKVEYRSWGVSDGNGYKAIEFGDCCKECREKILNDFIALGEKYIKRKTANECK